MEPVSQRYSSGDGEPEKRSGARWLLWGCLGCFGLMGLAVAVLAVLVVVPFTVDRPAPEPVHRQATPELPPPPEPVAVPPDSPSPGSVTLPEVPPDEALVVDLDLGMGTFVIEPAAAGEPLQVEADYDEANFELEEGFDAEINTYRVRFGARGGSVFRWFGDTDASDNRVTVRLPADRPLNLDLDIGVGESTIDLGGLWLIGLELDTGPGEHRLDFSRPLRAPLEALEVDGSVGEVVLANLGNASPARLKVNQGIGDMTVDLHGAWQRDARVSVDLGIGECRVRVPEDVRVDLERSGVGLGETQLRGLSRREPPPEGAPTLTLELTGGIGEMRVDS